MDWKEIKESHEIKDIVARSATRPVIIFKHSTRCSISTTALNRIERNMDKLKDAGQLYLINVIRNRSVSNAIAEEFSIRHESPQVLVFINGRCAFHASHLAIDANSILQHIQSEA